MKLQFKTDDLLKKVEGLIIKDVAARKEHNRKVNIIKGKVDEYIAEKTAQRESEIKKAKSILAKYSDDELKEMFLEEYYLTRKGIFWNTQRKSFKHVDCVVELNGFKFKAWYLERNDVLMSIPYKRLGITLVSERWYYADENLNIAYEGVTTVYDITTPNKISTKAPEELESIKISVYRQKHMV